jgi:hypothetical protein
MTYKVSLSSGNNYSVKIPQSQKYKINYQPITQLMPQSLSELTDVELSGNNYDKYVLLYDSISGKWKDVNPDEVLSAATTTLDANRTTYTLPTDFEDKLAIDLDNKIDVDGGFF